MPETRLQTVRRQVSELESQVDKQRAVLAELRDGGQPWEGAFNLLKGMENLLSIYQADLARAEIEANRERS